MSPLETAIDTQGTLLVRHAGLGIKVSGSVMTQPVLQGGGLVILGAGSSAGCLHCTPPNTV